MDKPTEKRLTSIMAKLVRLKESDTSYKDELIKIYNHMATAILKREFNLTEDQALIMLDSELDKRKEGLKAHTAYNEQKRKKKQELYK